MNADATADALFETADIEIVEASVEREASDDENWVARVCMVCWALSGRLRTGLSRTKVADI